MKDINQKAASITYTDYLCLYELLSSQRPISEPPHHDELLFIIQHQTSELWMKLILHELNAAIRYIQNDRLDPCFKILARVKLIQRQLFDQWAVLETLTPSEYSQFRDVLQTASGLQSFQYRSIEFVLGNKDRKMLEAFEQDENAYHLLEDILNKPSIYEEFLRHLHRQGFAIPIECVDRDWTLTHERNEEVVAVFKLIYDQPDKHWDAYNMCEKLVDVEEQFQLWRFRHMKTVERIIGYKPGTGGTACVAYLKQALDKVFFPELFDVRTRIGA